MKKAQIFYTPPGFLQKFQNDDNHVIIIYSINNKNVILFNEIGRCKNFAIVSNQKFDFTKMIDKLSDKDFIKKTEEKFWQEHFELREPASKYDGKYEILNTLIANDPRARHIYVQSGSHQSEFGCFDYKAASLDKKKLDKCILEYIQEGEYPFRMLEEYVGQFEDMFVDDSCVISVNEVTHSFNACCNDSPKNVRGSLLEMIEQKSGIAAPKHA